MSALVLKQKTKYGGIIDRYQLEVQKQADEINLLKAELEILKEVLNGGGISISQTDLNEGVETYNLMNKGEIDYKKTLPPINQIKKSSNYGNLRKVQLQSIPTVNIRSGVIDGAKNLNAICKIIASRLLKGGTVIKPDIITDSNKFPAKLAPLWTKRINKIKELRKKQNGEIL